jgi:hypothetical protein
MPQTGPIRTQPRRAGLVEKGQALFGRDGEARERRVEYKPAMPARHQA